MRSIEPSPRGLIEIFRPQKRERHFLFHVKKQFTGGVFLSKKPASSRNTRDTPLSIRERDWTRCSLRFCPISSLMEKGGIGLCRHSIPATPLSIRKRDWTTRSLRFPRRHSPLSIRERDWTRCSLRFLPISSLMEREGLDDSVTSFPSPPFGLRPEAVILDRAVFASLSRGQSNPRRGFSSPVF